MAHRDAWQLRCSARTDANPILLIRAHPTAVMLDPATDWLIGRRYPHMVPRYLAPHLSEIIQRCCYHMR